MPLFDYRCRLCDQTTEEYVRHYAHVVSCPSCGRAMNKTFTKAPGVIMRPDGWNLRPDEPGYSSNLPTDVNPNRWQQS